MGDINRLLENLIEDAAERNETHYADTGNLRPWSSYLLQPIDIPIYSPTAQNQTHLPTVRNQTHPNPHPATNSQALDLATNAQATETIVRNRIGPPTTQNEVYNDSTYGVLTQSTHHTPQVYYGIGAWRRGVPPHPERTYRPPREIPLSSADACRCNHYAYEHAIHRIHDNYGAPQRTYNTIHRYRVRRHIFRTSAFSRATDRQLVEMRQARALAGLDVSGYDVEITSRILADPAAWGIVGREMRRRGWVDDVITEGTRLLPLDPL